MISRRPLTTLLLAATLCVDLVVSAESYMHANYHGWRVSMLSIALYFSQIGLLSLWLVLGRRYWSLRFLVWIVGLSLIGFLDNWSHEGATHFSLVAAFACTVCLLACFANGYGLIGSVTEIRSPGTKERWQFSLIHALVWTTFVAIVATALRFSDLPELRTDWSSIAVVYASAATIPVIAIVLLKGRRGIWLRFAGLFAYAGGVSLAVEIGVQGDSLNFVTIHVLQALITGIWIVAVDYDLSNDQMRRTKPDGQ